MSKKVQDIDGYLLHSEYFKRYILPDFFRKHPEEYLRIIKRVREDEESEKEVQYHITRVMKETGYVFSEEDLKKGER